MKVSRPATPVHLDSMEWSDFASDFASDVATESDDYLADLMAEDHEASLYEYESGLDYDALEWCPLTESYTFRAA